MPSRRPPLGRQTADEMPRSAVSDPPLDSGARTPGPPGLVGKLALAALGLIVLVAIVAGLWAASHFSRRHDLPRSRAEVVLTR